MRSACNNTERIVGKGGNAGFKHFSVSHTYLKNCHLLVLELATVCGKELSHLKDTFH